jgi:hypothetical protein
MTVREAWEEVSFQVFTDMGGVLRSGFYPTGNGIVEGNVQVDRVWGNLPLQPNDDRTDTYTEIGGGDGDRGYDSTFTISSDTLRTSDYYKTVNNVGLQYRVPADSHTIATTGYSNFPGYIPNYAGDGDTGLEIKIPNLVRRKLDKAQDLLDPFDLSLFAVPHVLTASYVLTTGTTARITAFDEEWNNWGGGYPNSQLIGIRVGDQLTLDLDIDGDGFAYSNVKVTALNVDGENSWFEFEAESPFAAIDAVATGTVYAGTNLVNKITMQRSEIRNEGQQVNVRYVEAP